MFFLFFFAALAFGTAILSCKHSCPVCGASGVPRDPTRSIASQRTFVRPSSACRAWDCKDSATSHPQLCHQSSPTLPIVIPNSIRDLCIIYILNTESSWLKLTTRRSLSQSKGRAKKMPHHPKQARHPAPCHQSSPTLPIVIPNSIRDLCIIYILTLKVVA